VYKLFLGGPSISREDVLLQKGQAQRDTSSLHRISGEDGMEGLVPEGGRNPREETPE